MAWVCVRKGQESRTRRPRTVIRDARPLSCVLFFWVTASRFWRASKPAKTRWLKFHARMVITVQAKPFTCGGINPTRCTFDEPVAVVVSAPHLGLVRFLVYCAAGHCVRLQSRS